VYGIVCTHPCGTPLKPPPPPPLRRYAHCTHKSMGMRGDVTLLLLNVDPHRSASVDTRGAGLRDKLSQHGRTEYHMTAQGATPTHAGCVRYAQPPTRGS
jgi:hypothetical protein